MPPATETRSYAENVRGVDNKKRRITVVISTFDLDSHGTRIDQSGWDFSVFRTNPVIPLAHDDRGYTGSNGLPVAKGVPGSIRTENQRTLMDIEFPEPGVFPLADTVFELARNGFLNAVSVGFEPLDWEDVDEEGADTPSGKVRIFRRQKLLEVSIVTIPSNSNALIQRARVLNREEDVETFRAMARRVEELTAKEEPAEPEVSSPAEGATLPPDMPPPAAPKDEEYVAKCVSYFEKKQPANRESTKALERFFKIRGEKQPSDEMEAWKRMAELLEEPAPLTEEETEQVKEEVITLPPAEATVPAAGPVTLEAAVETKEEVPPEAAPDTPPNPPTPAAEAPQPAPEAPVQLSLKTLLLLRRHVAELGVEAFVKASRKGVPQGEAIGAIDAVSAQLRRALTSHP